MYFFLTRNIQFFIYCENIIKISIWYNKTFFKLSFLLISPKKSWLIIFKLKMNKNILFYRNIFKKLIIIFFINKIKFENLFIPSITYPANMFCKSIFNFILLKRFITTYFFKLFPLTPSIFFISGIDDSFISD